MTFYYDNDADVLYVTFDESLSPCIYIESPSGAILRVSESTGQLASATIPFFSRRAERGELDFPELAGASLPPGFLESLRT
ncbi:MAG: hypothetical protein JWM83_3272 [Candidatus Angelobacter sp.]|nr:hypothetical protein [Candidatus Angelobacter sp.]